MNILDKIEIVGEVDAALAAATDNGEPRIWGTFGPVQPVNSVETGFKKQEIEQDRDIWVVDKAIGPPPKIGSHILGKLTSALQKLILDGIILNCHPPLYCDSDVTDTLAIRDVLMEILEALEIAWQEHLYFQRQMMTRYLKSQSRGDEDYQLSWYFMSYRSLPDDYLKFFLFGDKAQVFEDFRASCWMLYCTVRTFHGFVCEWSGLYRNGEALQQLKLIHVLLTEIFAKKASDWRQAVQGFRSIYSFSKDVMDLATIRNKLQDRFQRVQDMAAPRNRRCSNVSVSTDGGTHYNPPDSAYDSEFSDSPSTTRPRISESEESVSTLDTVDVKTGTVVDQVEEVESSPAVDEAPASTLPVYDPLESLAALTAFANMSLCE